MNAFNASLNPFDTTSLVSQINRNITDKVDTMLVKVIDKAAQVSEETEGAYDITGAPLFDIWGFGTRKGVTRAATKEEVDSILSFVGYQKLIIDRENMRIRKEDPRLYINPSSLSKGYVTDLVAGFLESKDITDYMVEIGGEIVCRGKNPQGECWRIGITRPDPDNSGNEGEILYRIPLCERVGVATSGDYRNYKLLDDGTKVAHTIDVRTGYPAHQDILSATVIAPTCMEADAWATAFMSMGLNRSLKVLQNHPELSVLFIYFDNEGRYTSYHRGIDLSDSSDIRSEQSAN